MKIADKGNRETLACEGEHHKEFKRCLAVHAANGLMLVGRIGLLVIMKADQNCPFYRVMGETG